MGQVLNQEGKDITVTGPLLYSISLMTALLITKTSRNNHTLYTKMYHNGGSLTNTITNKTKLYALRDGSYVKIHTP